MQKAYPLSIQRNNKNRYHIIIGFISCQMGALSIYDKIIVNYNKKPSSYSFFPKDKTDGSIICFGGQLGFALQAQDTTKISTQLASDASNASLLVVGYAHSRYLFADSMGILQRFVATIAQTYLIFGMLAAAKPKRLRLFKGCHDGSDVGTGFVCAITKRLLLAIPAGAPSIFFARLDLNGDGFILVYIGLLHYFYYQGCVK